MKYGRLVDFSFAGLSFFPFPMFLGGYPVLAALVFLVLLASAGLLGLIEQLRGNSKEPEQAGAKDSSPVTP